MNTEEWSKLGNVIFVRARGINYRETIAAQFMVLLSYCNQVVLFLDQILD